MIEFSTAYERDQWYKVVRAILNGRPATAEIAVEIADYVLEQDRARISKSMKQAREEFEKEFKEHQERFRRFGSS